MDFVGMSNPGSKRLRFKRRVVTATLISLAFLASCHPAPDRILEETFAQTYRVDPTARLSISNRDGSIRVYGAGGNIREVRVEAIKKAYTPERLKAISVKVAAQSDSISIETIYPPDPASGFADRSGTVDYVVVVPQTIRISRLDLANGEILMEEMRGEKAEADLGNGRLFVHNCFGNVNATVKTGNVALVWDWWEEFDFSATAKIENGNAFAYIPDEAAFHLLAHAITGKIANDFAEKEQRRAEPINQVDMSVGGGGTFIQLEALDGNIKIAEHNP
jgi:hypothetical protein